MISVVFRNTQSKNTLLHSVIGQENSCYPLNQSDANLKPLATWSLVSPAVQRVCSLLTPKSQDHCDILLCSL